MMMRRFFLFLFWYVRIHSQSFGRHSKQKQLIEFSSEQSTDRTKGRALNTKRGSEVGDL